MSLVTCFASTNEDEPHIIAADSIRVNAVEAVDTNRTYPKVWRHGPAACGIVGSIASTLRWQRYLRDFC